VKKITLLTVLLLFSGLSPLHGATLTLQDCIQKALHTHPDIKRFLLQVQRSQKEVDAIQADYLPQLSFNAEYDPTRTYVFPTEGMFHTRDSDGWQAGATVKQKIWDFSQTTSRIKAQEVQQDIAGLSLQDARALLAYKVKLQYEMILVQQKAGRVRKKDFQTKEELYKQAKALLDQGLKTRADTTRFLSAASAAKDNLSLTGANLSKARVVLSLYIGEPITPEMEFEESSIMPETYPADEETILQESPVLQSLQKNIDKNDLLYKATRGAHFGSIDAVASYAYQDTMNSYDSTMVGIMFNVPLYSGGRLTAREEQAIIDRQSAKNEYEAKVLALKEEFEGLVIDLKHYSQTIQAKTVQLQAAGQTLEVVNGRYREGLATYIEVLDAAAQQLDAELGLLQAGYDRSSAIHRLEYLQGISK
jgi:outer membrane protein TolC